MTRTGTNLLFALTLSFVVTSTWGGQFIANYPEASDPEFREWDAELREERVLETLVSDLNSILTIPTDVSITLGECGTANAFYHPADQAITICFELMRDIYTGALQEGWSEQDAERATMNATDFFFYHELGHALIHVLDLPTTGREEDAVDQLSVYVLAYTSEEDSVPALDAATAFLAWSREAEEAQIESVYWGEHSLNEQRFFNIVCWVYGQNPERFQGVVTSGILPEARAARCVGEWQKIDKSWTVLLDSYVKG